MRALEDAYNTFSEYMAAVDDLPAHTDDKPTIGLLLCRTKNNVVAEYALRSSTMPIGIAEWATNVSTALSDELTSALPRIEDIEAGLTNERGDSDQTRRS